MARLSGKICVITGGASGIGVPHDPEHASLANWREIHRVNLDGTFLGCRYAIAVMLASDEATCITGTEVTIDGGLLAGSAATPG